MPTPVFDPALDENLATHDHTEADLGAILDSRYLNTTSNLSDLNDVATARTNLGLVAGGAGDIWVEKAGDTMTGALTNTLATGNSLVWDTSTLIVDATNHRVGIGTTSPTSKLDVRGTSTITSSTESLGIFVLTADPSTDSAGTYHGLSFTAQTQTGNAYNFTQSVRGILGYSYHKGTGTLNNLTGIDVQTGIISSGNVTNERGIRLTTLGASSGVPTVLTGIDIDIGKASTLLSAGVSIAANSAATQYKYGLYIGAISGGTAVNRGIDIGAVTGTGAYSIYSAGGTMYHAGNVGIGTTAPTAKLHVEGSALFNEAGANVDFRVESDTEPNMIFLDANADTDGALYLGGSTNGLKVSKGGDLIFQGTATVFQDVNTGFAGAKVPAANAPTWTTLIGNIKAYTFAVNDYVDVEALEVPHGWKEGSDIEIHIHWATNGNNDATVRGVKWEVEYTWANMLSAGGTTAFGSIAAVSTETSIAASEPTLTHKYTSVLTFTPTGGKVGMYVKLRLKRIASVTNTAPASNPFGLAVGIHCELDRVGSRTTGGS